MLVSGINRICFHNGMGILWYSRLTYGDGEKAGSC
jgi:hypothetical protein